MPRSAEAADELARLDIATAQRGIAKSRTAAQAMIGQGLITVNGEVETQASRKVSPGDSIEAIGPPERYVSRGGLKLEAALDAWAIDPAGMRALDIGASTGGFTDCLLQLGAKSVTAVDVGHGQMAPALASDPRVELHEGVNARGMRPGDFGGPFDLIVADVSFISLTIVLPAMAQQLAAGGSIIALIKPQFEVGAEALGKGGIVRSETARIAAAERVSASAQQLRLATIGRIDSPIAGGDGNREYLVWLRRS